MNVLSTAVLLLAAASAQGGGLAIGDPLPDFSLPGVDGKTHVAAEYADAKVLVVLFTCNHCPTAQAYEDRIIKLEADVRDRGVKLIAVSPNDALAVRPDELGYSDLGDSLEDMKIRAKERGFVFPYLYDGETQKFSRKVGVRTTPHVFIFDADRKLRYKGRIDNKEIGEPSTKEARDAIDALLAGKPVKVAETRAFGCSTKWSDKRSGVARSAAAWAKREVTLEGADAAAVKKIAANAGENYLLVNVWATWCGPCVAEFPDVVLLQRMYGRRPFKLVTISIDPPGEKDGVLNFLKEKHASMTNLIFTGDDKDKLAEALDPKWEGPIPYTLFIAPGGKVIYRKAGEFDPQELKRTIVDKLGRTYASRKRKKKGK